MLVKFCGIRNIDIIQKIDSKIVSYLGFVFHKASPRNVTVEDIEELKAVSFKNFQKVGVFVNPGEHEIGNVLDVFPLDYLQLHGGESPEDCQRFKEQFNVKIIKAIPVSNEKDIQYSCDYEQVADILLLDAKLPKTAHYPGGHGISFDWKILEHLKTKKPVMIAGGISVQTIETLFQVASRSLSCWGVDMSSGIERQLGIKDPDLINEFIMKLKLLKSQYEAESHTKTR